MPAGLRAQSAPRLAGWVASGEGSTLQGDRPPLDVLLLDAQCRQVLTCLRTYARAGYRVGVAAGEADAWWAPGLQSRWGSLRAAVPDLSRDATAHVDAILALLDRCPTRMLLPAADGTIEALRARRADVERKTILPLASESALRIAVSKQQTLALAAELGVAVPASFPVHDASDLEAALRETGLPAVIKPGQSWVAHGRAGSRRSSVAVATAHAARQAFQDLIEAGSSALVQPWLPGQREAVTLFYARGQFWARLAQVSYREWPVLGGVSVLCETIPLRAELAGPAQRLVEAMNLEGCSMVEFRRNARGQPVLMEVNPRMGSSVALGIAAGVDFPRLLFEWKLGTLRPVNTYQVGRRLRWLPGDIWNLKCVLEGQGQPDVPRVGPAVASFILDFLRPGNTLDGVEMDDLAPSLAEMDRIVWRHVGRRWRKLLRRTPLAPDRAER